MDKELEAHFSKFGELVAVHLMKEEGSVDNKGCAVLQYAEGSNLEETLENTTHVIRGRDISAKLFFNVPAESEPL